MFNLVKLCNALDISGDRICQTWFERFKNGDIGMEDKERLGQVYKFIDKELELFAAWKLI